MKIMSGITTVTVKVGEYKCGECLKSALNFLDLSKDISIVQNGDISQISINKQTQRYLANKVENELSEEIQEIHQKILPKYTEFHAIHSLIQKGFKHIRTYQLDNSYKMIFEKIVGSGAQERIDRYEITVFPKENRILIDGGDMPANYCRQNAKNLQQSLGEFHSFHPHNSEEAVQIRNKVKIKQQQKIGKN